MLTLTDALRDLIADNPFLQLGLRKRLFNLSQLGRELKPQVEVRSKKEVRSSAILMALSRLQRTIRKETPTYERIRIEHLTIQTGLSIYTFTKTKEVHQGVNRLFGAVQKGGGYMTICEGMQEITIILEATFASHVKRCISQKPKHHLGSLVALGLTFNEEQYISTPGVICLTLQQLLLQGINLIEVSSTYSGLALYVTGEDAKLAFETLYRLFPKGSDSSENHDAHRAGAPS